MREDYRNSIEKSRRKRRYEEEETPVKPTLSSKSVSSEVNPILAAATRGNVTQKFIATTSRAIRPQIQFNTLLTLPQLSENLGDESSIPTITALPKPKPLPSTTESASASLAKISGMKVSDTVLKNFKIMKMKEDREEKEGKKHRKKKRALSRTSARTLRRRYESEWEKKEAESWPSDSLGLLAPFQVEEFSTSIKLEDAPNTTLVDHKREIYRPSVLPMKSGSPGLDSYGVPRPYQIRTKGVKLNSLNPFQITTPDFEFEKPLTTDYRIRMLQTDDRLRNLISRRGRMFGCGGFSPNFKAISRSRITKDLQDNPDLSRVKYSSIMSSEPPVVKPKGRPPKVKETPIPTPSVGEKFLGATVPLLYDSGSIGVIPSHPSGASNENHFPLRRKISIAIPMETIDQESTSTDIINQSTSQLE